MDRATVTINVIRNLFPPVFQGEPYNSTLTFNIASGTNVLQVTATDADSQVHICAKNRKAISFQFVETNEILLLVV